MDTTFIVERNIESLEEIVDLVPAGTIRLLCTNKGLRSLKGIERLPSITELYISGNQIASLEGLTGSNVTSLNVPNNKITSLKGLIGSNVTKLWISSNLIKSLKDLVGTNVTKLYISNNPCYKQFRDNFGESVQKVKEYYSFDDIKEPEFD